MPARGRERLIRAMANDLASVRAQGDSNRDKIREDLDRRQGNWLCDAARGVADWTAKQVAVFCDRVAQNVARYMQVGRRLASSSTFPAVCCDGRKFTRY